MSATVQVPVEVSAEAAARVAELGFQREMGRMIEHTRQTIPGLCLIEIGEEYDYEEGGPPALFLTAWRPGKDPSPGDCELALHWRRWFFDTFPPEVMRWVLLALRHREDYGR